ncbi:hypothetical protein HN448_03640, partial [archaeon]|nr:hypothetical protein [archaeon]
GAAAGGGGGSGGGSTYIVDTDEFSAGFTKELGVGDRFKVTISETVYYLSLSEVSLNSVRLSIDDSEITVSTGSSGKFNVDSDEDYDIKATVGTINYTGLSAYVTVKSTSDLVPTTATNSIVAVEEEEEELMDELLGEEVGVEEVVAEESNVQEPSTESEGAKLNAMFVEVKEFWNNYYMFMILVLAAITVGVGVYFIMHKHGKKHPDDDF